MIVSLIPHAPCNFYAPCGSIVPLGSKGAIYVNTDLRVCKADQVKTPKPAVSKIIDVTARVFGTSQRDIIGPSRLRFHCEPRFAAIYAARELTGFSWWKLSRSFGHRDHTTMLSAYRRAISWMQADADYAAQVDQVMAAFPETTHIYWRAS